MLTLWRGIARARFSYMFLKFVVTVSHRHRGISITLHVHARMYHHRDVPYILYLPTTVATTLFSLFRSDLDFSSKYDRTL